MPSHIAAASGFRTICGEPFEAKTSLDSNTPLGNWSKTGPVFNSRTEANCSACLAGTYQPSDDPALRGVSELPHAYSEEAFLASADEDAE